MRATSTRKRRGNPTPKPKGVAKSRGATGKATFKGRAIKTKQRKYVSA